MEGRFPSRSGPPWDNSHAGPAFDGKSLIPKEKLSVANWRFTLNNIKSIVWLHYKSRGMMDVWAMLGNKYIGGKFISKRNKIEGKKDKRKDNQKEGRRGEETTIKQDNKNEGEKKWN